MLDTAQALADMAQQIRECRAQDGLTLQQLASRSGVAASTIHKVEAQQMVPTVLVLLKIAKGLGRRPQELIRDEVVEAAGGVATDRSQASAQAGEQPSADADVGVWQIDLAAGEKLHPIELEPDQQATVLLERGELELQAGERKVRMNTGHCVRIEGGAIRSPSPVTDATRLTLIVSPPGELGLRLGRPSQNRPTYL